MGSSILCFAKVQPKIELRLAGVPKWPQSNTSNSKSLNIVFQIMAAWCPNLEMIPISMDIRSKFSSQCNFLGKLSKNIFQVEFKKNYL